MRTPKVTITFPVVGKDKFLGSCLKSIYSLDYPQEKLEIILVDNGLDSKIKYQIVSSRGFLRNVNIKNIKRIKWIQNKRNLGFVRAVNQGIRRAKGDFFLITNSDVILEIGIA